MLEVATRLADLTQPAQPSTPPSQRSYSLPVSARSRTDGPVQLDSGAGTAAEHKGLLSTSSFTKEILPSIRPMRGRGKVAPSSEAAVEEHLLLGVTVEFCRETARAMGVPPHASTADVGALVRAATATSGLSYAEQERGLGSALAAASIAPATIMVSHAQSCEFHEMLDAIDAYAELHGLAPSQTFLWLDIFSIRQNTVAQDVVKIGAIIERIGHVVMVLDPWDKPVALQRVWCLYEVVHAVSPVAFRLALPPSQRRAFVRALKADNHAVKSALSTFDSRTAKTSSESDRAMIFKLIQERFGQGGDVDESSAAFDAFNETVRRAVSDAVIAFSWELDGPEDNRLRRHRRSGDSPSSSPSTSAKHMRLTLSGRTKRRHKPDNRAAEDAPAVDIQNQDARASEVS